MGILEMMPSPEMASYTPTVEKVEVSKGLPEIRNIRSFSRSGI